MRGGAKVTSCYSTGIIPSAGGLIGVNYSHEGTRVRNSFWDKESSGCTSSAGGTDISGKGVCWGTSLDPTISGSASNHGAGVGEFTYLITSLLPDTEYFVRAYATNDTDTSYGENITFTTIALVLPSVTTRAITGVTEIRAEAGGNVSDDGGANITVRGICWSVNPSPSINDSVSTQVRTWASLSTQ